MIRNVNKRRSIGTGVGIGFVMSADTYDARNGVLYSR